MLLIMLLSVAAFSDLYTGKIPNRLIAAGGIAGAIYQCITYGWWGVLYFTWNISVPIILLFLFFQIRALGAGDIKLFSMIGGLLTFKELKYCMVFSFLAGGLFSVIYMISGKRMFRTILLSNKEKSTIAFSVAIWTGSVLALLYLQYGTQMELEGLLFE